MPKSSGRQTTSGGTEEVLDTESKEAPGKRGKNRGRKLDAGNKQNVRTTRSKTRKGDQSEESSNESDLENTEQAKAQNIREKFPKERNLNRSRSRSNSGSRTYENQVNRNAEESLVSEGEITESSGKQANFKDGQTVPKDVTNNIDNKSKQIANQTMVTRSRSKLGESIKKGIDRIDKMTRGKRGVQKAVGVPLEPQIIINNKQPIGSGSEGGSESESSSSDGSSGSSSSSTDEEIRRLIRRRKKRKERRAARERYRPRKKKGKYTRKRSRSRSISRTKKRRKEDSPRKSVERDIEERVNQRLREMGVLTDKKERAK